MEHKSKGPGKLVTFLIQAAVLIILVVVGGIFVLRPGEENPRETTETTTAPTQQTTQPATQESTAPVSLLPTNPYGKNDFQYYGDYLTCLTGESIMGIDVSRYQGDIDWDGFTRALGEIGYQGVMSLETVISDKMPEPMREGMQRSLAQIARYLAEKVGE